MSTSDYLEEHVSYFIAKTAKDAKKIRAGNRRKSVEWLIQKSNALSMSPRGIQLAIEYYEAYLSAKNLSYNSSDLIPSAALCLAFLMDKGRQMDDELSVLDRSFQEIAIVKNSMLITLGFQLNRVTASEIIRFFSERLANSYNFLFAQAEMFSDFCYINPEIYECGPLTMGVVACVVAFDQLSQEELKCKVLELAFSDFKINPQAILSLIANNLN